MKSLIQTISLESLSSATGGVYWSRRTTQLWNDYYRMPAGPAKTAKYQEYQHSANQGVLGGLVTKLSPFGK